MGEYPGLFLYCYTTPSLLLLSLYSHSYLFIPISPHFLYLQFTYPEPQNYDSLVTASLFLRSVLRAATKRYMGVILFLLFRSLFCVRTFSNFPDVELSRQIWLFFPVSCAILWDGSAVICTFVCIVEMGLYISFCLDYNLNLNHKIVALHLLIRGSALDHICRW